MSGEMTISPLVLPGSTHGERNPIAPTGAPARRARLARTPPPLACLPAAREGHAVYGFGAVDGRGRVSDLLAPRALGWAPGTRIEIRVLAGLVVVRARADAVARLTGQGYLRLPAPVRRWCGLVAGDRVLLVAEPALERLVVHPPASLDRLVAHGHAALREEATSSNDTARSRTGEWGTP